MANAASRGHFPVVKWLHENIAHEDFQTMVLDLAVFNGDLSLLKWLHTNRPNERWSTFAVDIAAQCGHLHVLRWLLDHKQLYKHHGFSIHMRALTLAIQGNHFDAVLLVHYEFQEWNSSSMMPMNNDSYNDHIKAWLQEELGLF
ncbi:hypothetical protein P3T76_002123 [Phytophthora citrophthora]|uniref:Ankyrin repeat-containing domain n=1 Tax=Phytophthora citrophthora TaxID=4793 RepID=A0AAD9GXU5_9STRA|nr:hypothetical protein P3T76_002123 [Phytophthora citrophthora]